MYETIQIPREELYEKVWSTPLLQLAKSIGVSDVALAKACRRAAIPLPGRGFWAKNERSRGRRPALPPLKDPYYATLTFRVTDPEDFSKQAKRIIPGINPIPVPEILDQPHPLVAKTLEQARRAKKVDGVLKLNGKRALNLHISPDLLERSVRLFDALIKSSEALGHRWKFGDEGTTCLSVDGETLKVMLKERLKVRQLPPPPPKQRPGARPELNLAALRPPQYEWISTGQLSFQIDAELSDHTRRTWNDTPNAQLESKLHEILSGLVVAAESARVFREKCEAQQRQWEEEKRQRIAYARHAEEQRRLRHKLIRAIERWEQSQRIRTFCKAALSDVDSLSPEQQAAALAWSQWVNQQADRLDPFQDREQLFSLHAHVEEWFTEGSAYPRDKPDWWSVRD